jgi:uncharacterized protein YgiM (DUF1202 family)
VGRLREGKGVTTRTVAKVQNYMMDADNNASTKISTPAPQINVRKKKKNLDTLISKLDQKQQNGVTTLPSSDAR